LSQCCRRDDIAHYLAAHGRRRSGGFPYALGKERREPPRRTAREGDVSTDRRDERAYIFVWLGMFILVTFTGWGIVAGAPLALAASRIFEPHAGPRFVFVGVVVVVCALLTTVMSRRSGSNSGVATGCLFSVAVFIGGVVVAIPTFAISGWF
jgi:hypothetical protein